MKELPCVVCEDGGWGRFRKGEVIGYSIMWMCDKHTKEYDKECNRKEKKSIIKEGE